jgi:hypothetical protein
VEATGTDRAVGDADPLWGRGRPTGRALRIGFALDVASYGARPVPGRDAVQERLRDVVAVALTRCGVTLDGLAPGGLTLGVPGPDSPTAHDLTLGAPTVDQQWSGDGCNIILPPDVDPPVVLSVLIRSLTAALGANNARHGDRIRLRMAAGVGLVEPTATGFGGPMIVEIGRLVDSAALRDVLRDNPAADLAVALSDLAYALIVKPGYPGLPAGQFVPATATAKEFSGTAWLWTATRQWSEPAYLPLQPGDPQEVGGFRVVARLGRSGPAATVYLACREGTDRAEPNWAALKVFCPRLAADPDARRRLLSGAVAAKVVRESGITPVIATPGAASDANGGTGGGTGPLWVASVLVRGPSLAETIAETGPLPADTVGWIALDLARALATAHQAGLAHHAVSPRNVLLSVDGAVLTDFGINANALTNGPGTPADDVLMLGAIVYFATTGYSPWDGDLDLTGRPFWLEPIVRACLAADPARRPAAGSVQTQLAGAIEQRSASWLPSAVASRVTEYGQSVRLAHA